MDTSIRALPKLLREPQLVKHLTVALQEQYQDLRRLEPNINPASAGFRRRWEKDFSVEAPLPQPEIDLLVIRRNQWIGIELKYLKYQRAGKSRLALPPYYSGIGQALALLRYGFDSVSLWHCFSSLVDEEDILKRAGQTADLIHDLTLPIGYVTLIAEDQDVVTFRTASVYRYPVRLVIEPGVPNPFLHGRPNPFRDEEDAKRIREFIAQARGILTF